MTHVQSLQTGIVYITFTYLHYYNSNENWNNSEWAVVVVVLIILIKELALEIVTAKSKGSWKNATINRSRSTRKVTLIATFTIFATTAVGWIIVVIEVAITLVLPPSSNSTKK